MTTEQDRAPGWFQDPSTPADAARRRWWDGTAWTVASRWDGTQWVLDEPPAAPAGGRTRRIWLGVVLGVLVLGVAGCGALVFTLVRWNSADPGVDHGTDRSLAESPTITEQLVEVPGYLYQDVSDAEIRATLDRIRAVELEAGLQPGEGVAAVSLHSVESDDPLQNTALGSVGTEVGFLQLYEPADALPAGSDEQLTTAGRPVDEFDVGEVHVTVFEDPSTPQSRFNYTWSRHGVVAAFDGATRAETQRWVRAYLSEPVRVGSENQALGDAAGPVEGYAYTNTTLRPEDVATFVTEPIGDVPYSTHVVTDDTAVVGRLLLVDPGEGFDPGSLVAAELASVGAVRPGVVSEGVTDHAGVAVGQLRSPAGDVHLWTHDGVVGILLTTDTPESAGRFIDAFLAAR